jgi:CheY-like chemotaxis protein
MAHAFDVRDLERLLDDAECLRGFALEHQRGLEALVRLIEANGDGGGLVGAAASAGRHPKIGPPPPVASRSVDVLVMVRELLAASHVERRLAERMVMRLVGDCPHESECRRRVLVVDDAPDNRELVAMVLEASGLQAMTASNGLEGVIAAHCATPAVIIMDLLMPVLGGLDAARLLKLSAPTRRLNLIAYTATPDSIDGRYRELFVEVLQKPSHPQAIVEAVKRHVAPD